MDKIKIENFKVETDIETLLMQKAEMVKGENGEVYLLSFHDDGVVWGKVKGENGSRQLLTSGDYDSSGNPILPKTPSPKFRTETLQELRLFGGKGQLHIWRMGENEFQAGLTLESYLKNFEPIDETQVLYGTDYDGGNEDFMIVRDGSEGLKHAFPLVDKNKFDGKKRPLRLHVKHYIEYDQDGCARIAFSRLVNVSVE